jgi:hypothetical protein
VVGDRVVGLVRGVVFARARLRALAARRHPVVVVVTSVVVTLRVVVVVAMVVGSSLDAGEALGRGVGVPVTQVGVEGKVRRQPDALERDREGDEDGSRPAPSALGGCLARDRCRAHAVETVAQRMQAITSPAKVGRIQNRQVTWCECGHSKQGLECPARANRAKDRAVKHTHPVLLSVALLVTLTGCPADSGSKSGNGHDHGSGAHDHDGAADHAHGDGGGHDHDGGGASDGVLARITQGDEKVGYLRLKLHDDKGDLELWLARDAELAQPFDLPLDATIKVTFTDKGNKTVTLRVRNRDKNEDEDGEANVRDGKTNYFIFPGDTGEDAAWLKGADFLATVKVAFSTDGKEFSTSPFVLRPHTH